MNTNETINYLINDCDSFFSEKIPSAASLYLSILLEAEEDGIIKRNWRSQVNVEALTEYIQENILKVEMQWEKDYRKLKQILDYGGKMLYEEMMLILGLRTDLESGLRFVKEKPKNILEDLDESMKDVLKLNLDKVQECRVHARRNSGCLECSLTKHWWWRFDEK